MGSKAWLRACIGLFLTMAASGGAWAEPEITWQATKQFSFFLDPADTEVHRATWESLTPEQRVHPILSAETLLAERHPDGGWAATMYDKTCWDAKTNRYACRERRDYLNPKGHKVRVSLRNLDDAATVDCTWLTVPQGRGGGRGDTATMPCDTP